VLKRVGRSVGAVKHICMEITQGNSLCSYLYLKLARAPCISFYLLCFFFYKIEEQEDRTGTAWGDKKIGTSGKCEETEKSVEG
jgi:hypothetical protein